MTAQILDGKALAAKVRGEIKSQVEVWLKEGRVEPRLDVIIVGDDPASQVYVAQKEKMAKEVGFEGHLHRLPGDATEEVIAARIAALNDNVRVNGILLQLPLPKHLSSDALIARIDPNKDVDGLSEINLGKLFAGNGTLIPCTPKGCMRLIQETGVSLAGKRALVVGRSRLVGKPIGALLLDANATVTMAHSKTTHLQDEVNQSDILVAAVGIPNMIKGEWIKPGAVVIDVGINRMPDGKLVGDVETHEAEKNAAFITPVPGGVGPMTIAMLLENTLVSYRVLHKV